MTDKPDLAALAGMNMSEREVMLAMADRLEAGNVGVVNETAPVRCESCPFRGMSKEERRTSALIPKGEWPCHTLDLHGEKGIECAGHAASQRKYGEPTPALIRAQAEAKS